MSAFFLKVKKYVMSHRQIKRIFIPLATAAIVLLALPGTTWSAVNTEPNSAGGPLIYLHDQEPPYLWGGWVQQAYLSRQVFDYLVSYDEGQIRPWLATSWSESADRKIITYGR